MRPKRTNGRDWTVAAIADRQCGVVSRGQLRDAGISAETIARAIAAGRLRRMFSGVYAVGHVAVSHESWWMAALLAGGPGSALSHHTAGVLWGLWSAPTPPVHLTSPGQRGRREAHLHVHRSQLSTGDTVVRDGLRVTVPARTIVDLAGALQPRQMREVVERAQDLRRFDPAGIRAAMTSRPRLPGTRALGALVDLHDPDRDRARSHLERLFLALVRAHRLPIPEVNVVIGRARRDFVWHAARLVVETDGYRYHSSRAAQRRDRRRDRALLAAEWRPARFTYEEVAFEPAAVARELAILLAA